MKKGIIALLAIAIIVIGIISAISINNSKKNRQIEEKIEANNINEISDKVTDECTEELNNSNGKSEIEANSTEEKISPTASLTLKKYYKQCEHTINEYITIPKELVNKTKDELEKLYDNWEVQYNFVSRV